MCSGVRTESEEFQGRVPGAGPSGGRYIILPKTLTPPTNVPTRGKFVSASPFRIQRVKSSFPFAEYLFYEKENNMKVKIVENSDTFRGTANDGTPFWKIASLHGVDVVAATINKYCSYWENKLGCKFCAIQHNIKEHNGKNLAVKKPEHLVEAVIEAEKQGFCKHITLTAGSTEMADRGLTQYIPYIKELREQTSIPIHVQTEPPENVEELSKLYDIGVDTIGIHVESFDEKVRREICPGKARISLDNYFKAWRKALEIFGENQVDTFILAGLGENYDETSYKMDRLCSEGIIPYIVPFRPLPETDMENFTAPEPSLILRILDSAATYMKKYGLRLEKNKAGCVRCGACSPIREALMYGCD